MINLFVVFIIDNIRRRRQRLRSMQPLCSVTLA